MDYGWKFHLGDEWGTAEKLDKAGVRPGPAARSFGDAGWRRSICRTIGRLSCRLIPAPMPTMVSSQWDRVSEKRRRLVSPHLFLAGNGQGPPPLDPVRRSVYRDCRVFFNGWLIGHNESGYSGFRYDVTDLANCGGDNDAGGAGGRFAIRGVVLRRGGHLPPRLAAQDRAAVHRAGWSFCL